MYDNIGGDMIRVMSWYGGIGIGMSKRRGKVKDRVGVKNDNIEYI